MSAMPVEAVLEDEVVILLEPLVLQTLMHTVTTSRRAPRWCSAATRRSGRTSSGPQRSCGPSQSPARVREAALLSWTD